MTEPLVKLEHVSRRFDVSKPWLTRMIEGAPVRILTAVNDVSFELASNSVYALVGESGSGKSTIGRMLVGLLAPSEGRIEIAPGTRRQMIFQSPYASMNPRWRVGDIIAEPMRPDADRKGRVTELLEQVGLSTADAVKFPHQFSGGQRQRIAVARALAAEPQFIVCDEPTSALDVSVQAQVLNLMKDLQSRHALAYLFISHDLSVVRYMADRIGVLYLGGLVEEAAREALFDAPRHPYTKLLIAAAPRLDNIGGAAAIEPSAGEIPDPIDPPSGCAFHPRCPLADDRCRQERPALESYGERRVACHAVQEGRD